MDVMYLLRTRAHTTAIRSADEKRICSTLHRFEEAEAHPRTRWLVLRGEIAVQHRERGSIPCWGFTHPAAVICIAKRNLTLGV